MVKEKKTKKTTKAEAEKELSACPDKETELSSLIEEKDAEIAKLKEGLLYEHAELENYKRRQEKRYQDALKYAAEPLVKDLLPVLDNLERSMEHIDDEDKNAFVEGIEHVISHLRETLSSHGVEEVEAEGIKFDPNVHEALAQVPGDEPGIVMAVHEKGYTLKGKLLRPAKVLVSKLAT